MTNLVEFGSNTARNGFRNEHFVADKFNNWNKDAEAQQWLSLLGCNLDDIEQVNANVLHGYKADVNVQIKLKNSSEIKTENIQVKLVSNKCGFNQVDKRWLSHYQELWDMPEDVFHLLQYFTGEIPPYKQGTRDSRRMFFPEMTGNEREIIYNWFSQNKALILTDIIKGRGEFCANWILVIRKIEDNMSWSLKSTEEALEHYGSGGVTFSPRGSLNIGQVGMQRKGGDGGRKTANMLQFKLDPTSLMK